MSFLDVLARQVLPLRERHRARLPLVPMNSAATRGPSLGVLCRYDGLRVPDFAIRYNRTARPCTWTYDARADHARHLARHGSGQSLNAYLIDVLTRQAETPTMSEVLADVEAIRRPTGLTGDDAVAAVREARDSRGSAWA